MENKSDHALALQRALLHCEAKLERIHIKNLLNSHQPTAPGESSLPTTQQQHHREEALQEFRQRDSIPIVDINNNNQLSVLEFRQKYLHNNIPCLVRGLRDFDSVTKLWSSNDGTAIDREWFRTHVKSTKVPVRHEVKGEVDAEGRAEECETTFQSMESWIDSQPPPECYLKDWHLVKELEQEKEEEGGVVDNAELYTVPDIFERDLLNQFLLKTTRGDYRFVYWGPKGSHTPLHSDVLNSFSWSYNVVGVKEWTFYLPSCDNKIVVHQHATECIFVPSGWRHKVTNLTETLSINHNWITVHNVDKMWDCIVSELGQVEKECQEWEIVDLEARESMLRGCVGLDISTCFLLLLSALLDAVLRDSSEDMVEAATIARLMLEIRFKPGIDVCNRLAASLEDNALSDQVMVIAAEVWAPWLNAYSSE